MNKIFHSTRNYFAHKEPGNFEFKKRNKDNPAVLLIRI